MRSVKVKACPSSTVPLPLPSTTHSQPPARGFRSFHSPMPSTIAIEDRLAALPAFVPPPVRGSPAMCLLLQH